MDFAIGVFGIVSNVIAIALNTTLAVCGKPQQLVWVPFNLVCAYICYDCAKTLRK